MSALVSLPPSPVMPRSPDSFSSRSSSPSSGSSSQPPLPTYTSFDITKLGQARPITFSQPLQPPSNAATRRSARPTHRSSQSMSRLHYPAVQVVDFATTAESTHTRRTHHSAKSVGTFDSGNAAAAMAKEESKDAGTVDKSRSRPTPQRSRTLSFSATQQAFLPSRSHLSASVSSAAAGLPFPTVDEGKAASSVALDRTSSVGSSASASVRRPRPSRVSLSARSGSSLRVPAATSASRADHNASEYLEAKVVIRECDMSLVYSSQRRLTSGSFAVGSQGVGKTSLITRSTTGRFSAARTSTIGASLLAKKLVIDNTKVHLQLWDAAGQERFRTLAPLFYRGALAAVLVYDVTDEASLQDVKFWMAGQSHTVSFCRSTRAADANTSSGRVAEKHAGRADRIGRRRQGRPGRNLPDHTANPGAAQRRGVARRDGARRERRGRLRARVWVPAEGLERKHRRRERAELLPGCYALLSTSHVLHADLDDGTDHHDDGPAADSSAHCFRIWVLVSPSLQRHAPFFGEHLSSFSTPRRVFFLGSADAYPLFFSDDARLERLHPRWTAAPRQSLGHEPDRFDRQQSESEQQRDEWHHRVEWRSLFLAAAAATGSAISQLVLVRIDELLARWWGPWWWQR